MYLFCAVPGSDECATLVVSEVPQSSAPPRPTTKTWVSGRIELVHRCPDIRRLGVLKELSSRSVYATSKSRPGVCAETLTIAVQVHQETPMTLHHTRATGDSLSPATPRRIVSTLARSL